MKLHLDFEAYSGADIKSVGAAAYAAHPTTRPLMLAWALDDEPVQVWDIEGKEVMPSKLFNLIEDPRVELHAYNAPFERNIFKRHFADLEKPAERWHCTAAASYCASFAGKLDEVLAQAGVPLRKNADGQKLINRFSKPTKHTRESDPLNWHQFKLYCAQDVEVERELHKKVARFMTPEERQLWLLDQKINDAGLPIDSDLVNAACDLVDEEMALYIEQLKEITGLENPNSRAQLQGWLKANGLPVPNMQAATIAAMMPKAQGKVLHVLDLQQRIAKTSNAKWYALRDAVVQGRLHGAFQYAGASRTGRWAGRIFQPQNLPRSVIKIPEKMCADIIAQRQFDLMRLLHNNVMDVASSTLRCAITAPEGEVLIASDYSSIESRVLGWISECPRINNAFKNNLDTYKDFATEIYRIPYSEVTKQQRNFAKPPTLGCGYRLGADGLIEYAKSYGVVMDKTMAKFVVDRYREVHPEVVQFWYDLEKVTEHVITTGKEVTGRRMRFFMEPEFYCIQLPSGRVLRYHLPEMRMNKTPWGDMKLAFTYMGRNTYTRQWERLATHGGGLTENIVQAIARDILADGLLECDLAGFNVVGHVHDEIIITTRNASELTNVEAIMSSPPAWAPGLLLNASGFCDTRYRKD